MSIFLWSNVFTSFKIVSVMLQIDESVDIDILVKIKILSTIFFNQQKIKIVTTAKNLTNRKK